MKRTLLLILLCFPFLAPVGALSEPVVIRNGYVVPVANWAPLLEAKKGLARHWGRSYVMESVRFQGTPGMITALANGQLELAILSYSALALAIQNAGMTDLRVVADELQDGVPGFYSNEFFVRKDSGVTNISDMRGKVVATNEVGSGSDIAFRAALKKAGLEDKRDYTVIEAPFPSMPALLVEKKADLVTGVMPIARSPVFTENAKVLFRQRDGLGRSQLVLGVMRKPFIDKNRDALVDFMDDVLRIERWYLDPTNHDEVVRIAATLLKQPADRLSWVFTKEDYYRDPNGKPDLGALQNNIDVFAELGFVKPGLRVGEYADLSIVEEAAARLR